VYQQKELVTIPFPIAEDVVAYGGVMELPEKISPL
jgi:hypothetical protein